jgi:hypothetical protein
MMNLPAGIYRYNMPSLLETWVAPGARVDAAVGRGVIVGLAITIFLVAVGMTVWVTVGVNAVVGVA